MMMTIIIIFDNNDAITDDNGTARRGIMILISPSSKKKTSLKHFETKTSAPVAEGTPKAAAAVDDARAPHIWECRWMRTEITHRLLALSTFSTGFIPKVVQEIYHICTSH